MVGIFKEYDIRGIYPNEIDEDKAYLIGKSIGTYLTNNVEGNGRKIYIGYDTRKGSAAIKDKLIRGLLDTGVDTYDLGLTPIMIPAFASFKDKTYSISITASHNPPQYTGVLIFKDGFSLRPDVIEPIFNLGKFSSGNGKYKSFDYSKEYIEYILNGIGNVNVKIAIDTMGGATTNIVKKIFSNMNFEMVHNSFSQDFYGKTPEPSEKNSGELADLIRRYGMDFGAQFDGDGDRVAFLDENGRFIDPMITALIFIKYLRFKRVVANVSCSSVLENYAEVIYTPVGRPFIEHSLIENRADLGVETANHFYFAHYYPFSDGILAALLMAKVISDSGKKLSDMVNEFPKIYLNVKAVKFDDEGSRNDFMKNAVERLSKLGNINSMDGIKVSTKEGFILVRKSNTEPLIRITYEGRDQNSMAKLENIVNDLIAYGGKLVS